jgi:hypothetical protein
MWGWGKSGRLQRDVVYSILADQYYSALVYGPKCGGGGAAGGVSANEYLHRSPNKLLTYGANNLMDHLAEVNISFHKKSIYWCESR